MDNYIQEQKYIRAKKRVKEIKGFYAHLTSYIAVNIFISSIIVYGMIHDGDHTFLEAIQNFGVWSVWFFWGIGMFFHWLGVFGFRSIVFGKNWEDRKIKELMDEEDKRRMI